MASPQPPNAGFWPAIAAGRRLSADECRTLRPAIERFADFVSPALADWLLSHPDDGTGPLLEPDSVHRSRLRNRFTRAQGLHWLAAVAESGVEVVCLKGMAAGSLIYPDPDLRRMSDVDLLVRPRDLKTLVSSLSARGFAFRTALGTPRWGHIGDAGFHPFVAPGGTFSFDLHVQPDDYPIHRGLSVDAVFARSRRVLVDGVLIRVPASPHFLLLALANAARDKLSPEAMKSAIDALIYLARTDLDPGWAEILATAETGGFTRTVWALVAFLACLGVPLARLPTPIDSLTSCARREIDGAVAEFAACFLNKPSRLALQ